MLELPSVPDASVRAAEPAGLYVRELRRGEYDLARRFPGYNATGKATATRFSFPLKIAQPFRAGGKRDTNDKSRRDGRTVLSSLAGLGSVAAEIPSAKALGYCRK